MKKIATLLSLGLLSIALLTACAQTDQAQMPQTSAPDEQSQSTSPTPTAQDEMPKEETLSDKITFESTDTKGNTVTSEVFRDYDLTMINVWGTGCVPCIEEMPGLAKFHDQLPENVNMFSICVDYDADPEFAEDVLSQSNANFTTLKVSDSLYESVLVRAQALPTTIFVDSQGNIVGDVILGAPAVETDEKVVEHYMEYVNEKLGEVA